ncbi:MAG: DUF2905 domain-containing protein [Deltaproteobacteria bacterium]|nr:DUF2905 domain-containing protein [Deltaproteobacteria bacterium]
MLISPRRRVASVTDFSGMGKTLMIVGLIVAGIGLLLLMSTKFSWIGHLPGDFHVKGKNFSFYFPLATSLLFSVILTIFFWFINRK